MNSKQRYELLNYLYRDESDEKEEVEYTELEEIWDNWHCMILIEASEAFYDKDYDAMEEEIRQELKKDMVYLNLNTRQSVVLFEDPKADYRYIANHIYTFLKLRYPTRFHLAASEKFTGHEHLPEMLHELERWMESKYYHIEDHILSSEEAELAATEKEVMDSRLVEKISHDVTRKDSEMMWKHYGKLESKYRESSLFSAVYVKFVFASVVEALCQDEDFGKGRNLIEDISEIYCSRNEAEVIQVVKRNAEAYAAYAEGVARENEHKILAAKAYIQKSYRENMDTEVLAEKFDLLPGYLMFQFRILIGQNLNRYIFKTRMKTARELLATGKKSWAEVADMVGYKSAECFGRMYRQYFGE